MTIKDELLALKEDGLIIAEHGVEWARRNPDSALHGALEWDDARAGHEYRLWQIRRLIAIHVVSDEGTRQVVSLTVDRGRPSGGYRDLSDVLSDRSLREVLLADALAELDRLQKKYETLQELSRVWAEKEKVRRRGRKEPARVSAQSTAA